VKQRHFRYGSPRAREELRNACGERVSLKKAARLTRESGLHARRRGKRVPTTASNHGLPVCENLLNREFQAETAGAKWVPDSTCLRVLDRWICLTVVLDLYDRKAIGWHSALIWRRPARAGGHGVSFRPGCVVSLNQFSRRFERPPSHGPPEHEMRRGVVGTTPAPNHSSKP
jgi:transposase InsO family protein